MQDYQISMLFEQVEELREKVKNNKKAMVYYEHLKEINRGDVLYGWMFTTDDILEDTIDDLSLYQNAYIKDVLQVYKNELENILLKIEL